VKSALLRLARRLRWVWRIITDLPVHAIATSQPSVSGPAPAGGAVRDILRDKDNAAKDDASFDTLVTAAQQEERPDAPSDAPKAQPASTPDKSKPQEKTARKAADDSGKAEADVSAQTAPVPDAAASKPHLHAALNEDAAGAAQEPVAATAAADSVDAIIAQAGQAAPPQDQAALAATAAPKAAAPADIVAEKKTNSVQAPGQHAEQRSDGADAMPGGKPVEQAKALNDQGQGQSQDQNQDQAGTKDSSAARPDQTAKPDQTAETRPDTKDAGLKTLMETARAEMAPEAAPRPQVQAPATNMAVSGLVGLDTSAPTQTATPTTAAQHVQVTAQDEAAPDLPRLAVDITARSQGGAKQFDIRLDPPELGRVEVRLSIDHDGKTSAHLTAEQPRTLDLLQRDSVLLARALRDAGLDVSQDNLNFSLRQQAQDSSHSLAGHHGQGQGQGQGRGSRGLAASRTIEATATSAAWRTPSDGRLDIRV